ncbi:hypothetical protein ACO34A_29015 (plasmid) [Rhizobium sp. ACO-34A]|nr:putative Ig domain-containing protein [Rhizobium sp. ACO-34A]ATN37805.1 hypothetical protein ACO34A_29015 [Rhizobium sp. ACO-34A]
MTFSPAPGALPGGVVGTPYSQTITASQGNASYSYGITAGSLPAGLSLDASTGVVSGTPTAVETAGFTITATDTNGATGSATYDINIADQVPAAGPVSVTVAANSTANPIGLDISGGAPATVAVVTQPSHGAAVASGTTITYTPAPGYSGPDWFTYTATNASGTSTEAPVTITVTAPTLVFSPASGALPDGMAGTPYNQTITASQGTAPYSYAVTTGALPDGLLLDPSSGAILGSPRTMETASFTIMATDANGATGSATYDIVITDRVPVAGPVSATVAANSTANPISLYIIGGAPATVAVVAQPSHGAAVASGTAITYTPAPGYSGMDWFTYTATNASGTSAEAPVAIRVTTPSLEFSPVAGTLPGCMVGATYNEVVTASRGTAPYSYAVTVGALPAGLSLDPSSGAISGTPTAMETASFTITATDANGASGAAAYVIDVADQLPISGAVTATVAANSSANQIALDITGGAPTSVAIGAHPDHGTATISGMTIAYTPTAGYSGQDSFTYTATNATGTSAEATVTITVTPPTLIFSPNGGALPGGMVGTIFDHAITASQGMAPYRYEVTAGALPAGLVLDPTTGRISGSPTAMETASFTITATDANGAAGSAAYTIDIADQIPISGAVSATIAANSSGDVIPLSITGGTPATVAVTSPASHGTATASGVTITYTPTPGYSGPDSFTYTAMNASGTSAEAAVTITVTAPTLVFSPASGALPGGTAGTAYSQTITVSGGTAPYGYTVTSGALPAGLTLSSEGEISGTPTTMENADFTITATDVHGASSSSAYTLVIAVQAPVANAISAIVSANSSANSLPLDIGGGLAASVAVVSAPSHGTAQVSGLEISYTPTAGFSGTDSFTYTATNASGTSNPATVSITVSPPSLVFTPASGALAAGTVGTAYRQEVTVEGGTAPYIFTATDLPEGLTLDPSVGTIAGTPAVEGTSAIDIAVTDANGAVGSVSYNLVIHAAAPVAIDKNVELLAGARGGPFTGAAIVTRPLSGTAGISSSGAAYSLVYNADAEAVGTVIVRYTLSSASGVSAPATVTFTVIARPDPSLDPEVIGLVRAQTETAKRFADTQITNFNQRLEQLHNEGERRSNSVGVKVGVEQDPDHSEQAYAPHENASRNPALDAIGRASPTSAGSSPDLQSAPVESLFGEFAFWSGGFVNFGTNDNGAINLDHTLVGVSAGVDYRFTPELTAGFGVGYGRDVTEVGSNGAESQGEAFSLAAYGSYRPIPGFFLDGLAGYSVMSFDSLRYVTATGDFATGLRSGDQVFVSLSAGNEYRNDGLLISPYGRLSGSHSTLDAFSETGADMWNLTYGEQGIDTLSGTLGLRFEYAIPMDWGTLTPRGRLEYTHDFEGSSRTSLGYADTDTLPYGLDVETFSRDHLAIGLGLNAQLGDSWTLGLDYRTAFGANGENQDHTFGARLGVKF